MSNYNYDKRVFAIFFVHLYVHIQHPEGVTSVLLTGMKLITSGARVMHLKHNADVMFRSFYIYYSTKECDLD